MAKRRAAEPLTFHVPWKRLLRRDLPGEPPALWAAPSGPPRKRRIDAGAMASPSKRRDGGEPEGRGLTPAAPPPAPRLPRPGEEPRGARPPRGGGDDGAGRAEPPRGEWGAPPRQLSEEFWQFNTFQFWRNPLPPIDLADIEAVNEDHLTKAKLQDRNEELEIAMES